MTKGWDAESDGTRSPVRDPASDHRGVDPVAPALNDGDVVLFQGDAARELQRVADDSVQSIVTSPPFWGLRDYGDEAQIGLEAHPDDWVAALVDVFRECRRALRPDGTMFVEVGDSYASGASGGASPTSTLQGYVPGGKLEAQYQNVRPRRRPAGLKPKDLVGAPWLLAFALRHDGWTLRSDVIWHKPNAMPESAKDRPARSHSYVFLFAKSERYFWNREAMMEPDAGRSGPGLNGRQGGSAGVVQSGGTGSKERWRPGQGRNPRSVWSIPTEGLAGVDHFAPMPHALAMRCIAAGSREGDTILDPFVGSGTTAIVARLMGRRCIGVDLSAVGARARLSQLTIFSDAQ